MASIAIEVRDAELNRELRGLIGRISNPQEALRRIGQTVRTKIDLGFRSQSDPGGTPWAPLSETTLSRRRGNSAHILRDTGVLANSFTHNVYRDRVEIGTADKRAGTHQIGARKGQYGRTRRGAPIPWGDIPARRMIPEPREVGADILKVLRKFVES